MLDPCALEVRTACALALLASAVSIILSVRLIRYVLRESKRLRDHADLEMRIKQAEMRPDGGRSAVLPPAPRR